MNVTSVFAIYSFSPTAAFFLGAVQLCFKAVYDYVLPGGKIIQALLGFFKNNLLVLAAWIFLDLAQFTKH